MKKLIPVLIVLSLVLTACSNFPLQGGDEPVTDAEMATRVAELLATMTTPTTELAFPPTSTPRFLLPAKVAPSTVMSCMVLPDTVEKSAK